jgi:hypothetical protein
VVADPRQQSGEFALVHFQQPDEETMRAVEKTGIPKPVCAAESRGQLRVYGQHFVA